MKESKDPPADFRTAFAVLALEMENEMENKAHPEDDELVLYHEGGLPAERQSAVKEHLLTCRECLGTIRDLKSFAEAECGASDSERPADFEKAAFYRALRPRLEEIEGANTGNTVGAYKANWWNASRSLAAVLGGAVLGLSFWGVSQQRAIARLSDFQINTGIHTLSAGQRTGEAAEEILQADRGNNLIFTPTVQAEVYEVWILDQAGSVLDKITGFEVHPEDGTLTLGVPPGKLPPGLYQIELYADGALNSSTQVESTLSPPL